MNKRKATAVAMSPTNYNKKFRTASSSAGGDEKTQVYFDNHMQHFKAAMEELKPTALVGCMYMLSDCELLQQLAEQKLPLSLLVDLNAGNWASKRALAKGDVKTWKKAAAVKLRNAYDQLTPYVGAGAAAIQSIGLKAGKSNSALMHHKFVVFLGATESGVVPVGAWTGSINFTKNSALNLENSLLIKDSSIANVYYQEWKTLQAQAKNLS